MQHKNEQLLASKRYLSLILAIANPFQVNVRRISKQHVLVKAKGDAYSSSNSQALISPFTRQVIASPFARLAIA